MLAFAEVTANLGALRLSAVACSASAGRINHLNWETIALKGFTSMSRRIWSLTSSMRTDYERVVERLQCHVPLPRGHVIVWFAAGFAHSPPPFAMSIDPWHEVKNEVQNTLDTAANLRASFLRIQSTASANSEELNWARNEVSIGFSFLGIFI
jgi:hypothetical protein